MINCIYFEFSLVSKWYRLYLLWSFLLLFELCLAAICTRCTWYKVWFFRTLNYSIWNYAWIIAFNNLLGCYLTYAWLLLDYVSFQAFGLLSRFHNVLVPGVVSFLLLMLILTSEKTDWWGGNRPKDDFSRERIQDNETISKWYDRNYLKECIALSNSRLINFSTI